MKFEAGLQDYSGIIGFGEAIRYLEKIGLDKIKKHEMELNTIITDKLNVELIGPKDPNKRGGIFSFNIKGMDVHHVAKILDKSKNIMVRSGAHCVHSWFNKHNLRGSVRASLYLYNTKEECETFVDEVNKIKRLL
jgi:cysteine desulfurase/selenocysteine lyase